MEQIFTIKVYGLENLEESIRAEIMQMVRTVQGNVSKAIFEHLTMLAQKELKGKLREKYIQALRMTQLSADAILIELDDVANYIEDGLEAGFQMLPHLLKNAKTGKNGVRYKNIPIENDAVRGESSGSEKNTLRQNIESEMKSRGIPTTIEMDGNGNPKLGTLHKFSVSPGPGIAQGKTGIPYLHNVKVIQKLIKTPQGAQVKKALLTFRSANSKQNPSQYWVHPGLTKADFFDKTIQWTTQNWERLVAASTPTD
jgi:hypothetical protein